MNPPTDNTLAYPGVREIGKTIGKERYLRRASVRDIVGVPESIYVYFEREWRESKLRLKNSATSFR